MFGLPLVELRVIDSVSSDDLLRRDELIGEELVPLGLLLQLCFHFDHLRAFIDNQPCSE